MPSQCEDTHILAPPQFNEFISRVATFCTTVSEQASSTDNSASISDELWRAFHGSGLALSPFSPELGGHALSEVEYGEALSIVLRMLGAADLSIARLYEGHLNSIGLVSRYGSPAQLIELANSVSAGALSGVWGADDAIGLLIVNGDDGQILRGRKILASGAGFVTRPLVTAKGTDGQQMCLLDLGAEYPHDIGGWQAQGMRATATGNVELSGCRIGTSKLVGAAGDFMRQPHFSGGAWRFCAAHLGAVERLVDLFRQHLLQTTRGNDPFQLQRVATCVAQAVTARLWIEEAARRLANDRDPDEIVAFVNLTRFTVERCALDVMETVQRGIGLRALVRPHDVERICRDLATYLRQPVPDLAMTDGARIFLNASQSVGEF